MIKETKLMKIDKIKKYYKNEFDLFDKDIILDSIKVFAVNDSVVEVDVSSFVSIHYINDKLVISIPELRLYDYILVKYQVVKDVTVLTIDAEDYYDKTEVKGMYTFILNENGE